MTLLGAGKVAIQNTTGFPTTMERVFISDVNVTDDCAIVTSIEKDNHSAVGVTYDASLAPNGRAAGSGFSIDIQRNLNQNFVNNEGCIVNYTIHG